MSNQSPPRLSSTEISSMWLAYLNDSLAIRMIKYFLNNVNDEDVRLQLQNAYNISDKHIKVIEPLLKNDELALPVGFSDSDIDLKAPKLYSDIYYLFYLGNMAEYGMTNISSAYYHSARTDVRKFYSDSLIEIVQFYQGLSDIMLSKGVFIRSPIVSVANETDFIDNPNFFAGIFKEPRSLLLVEIANIYSNMLTCLTGRSLMQGFSQVAKSDQIRKYFFEGKELLEKQIELFSNILKEEGVPVPSTSDMSVTDSIQAPFSDKLMLYHTSILNVIHARNLTDAIATSLRRDIVADFMRLSVGNAKYATEGVDLMIKNGWMEQPPQVVNHRKLVRA